MLTHWSIEAGWLLWSILLCFFITPAMYFLVRNTPEQAGLLPDGIKRASLVKNTTNGQGEIESNWTLQDAFDWFHGYNEILWFMMIFPLLAAAAALFSTQPLK